VYTIKLVATDLFTEIFDGKCIELTERKSYYRETVPFIFHHKRRITEVHCHGGEITERPFSAFFLVVLFGSNTPLGPSALSYYG
jgi:hypothetical protein